MSKNQPTTRNPNHKQCEEQADSCSCTVGTLLNHRRQIAHVWSIEDVQSERPDLSDDQAWLVLQDVDDNKSAEFGITWETIRSAAEQRYPTL